MANINFFALGGLDENGKNSYVLEVNGDIYVINTGIKVPIDLNYGIDTLIPDFKYLEKNASKIKGIFLTDVKNESFSALPWLIMNANHLKIYCSAYSKYLVMDRIQKYEIKGNKYEILSMNTTLDLGNIKVHPIKAAGSLPGVLNYNFETEDGYILFLLNSIVGNLGIYGNTDLNLIKKNLRPDKKILALFLDSGRSNLKGNAIDKIKVTPHIKQFFEETSQDSRIIIGAYDEEMVTLLEVLQLAKKNNRAVIIYGKTYQDLLELSIKFNKEISYPEFLDYKDMNTTKNAVIIVAGTVARFYQRMQRILEDNDVYLKLKKSDAVIVIAPPVNGLETDHFKTLDSIAKVCPRLLDISDSDHYPIRPAQKDILDIVSTFKPEYFIPLQGLYRYLVVALNIAVQTGMKKNNIFVLQNGKVLNIVNGKYHQQKRFISDVGEVIIDGFGVGDISHQVINERETMSRAGIISLSILVDYKKKTLAEELNIVTSGVVSKENKTEVYDLIKSSFFTTYEDNKKDSFKNIQEKIRKVIRKKIFKKLDKEPIVLVTFYEY